MINGQCFPVWIYDAEIGILAVNVFGRDRRFLRARQRREIAEVIRGLRRDARAGRIKLDTLVVGWPGDGRTPHNAVSLTSPAMSEWIRRSFTVAVRAPFAERDATPVDGDAGERVEERMFEQ